MKGIYLHKKHSEETKRKMSLVKKGKMPKNIELLKSKGHKFQKGIPSQLGFKHSEETKKLLSEKGKGRKQTEEWKIMMSKRNSGKNNPFYKKNHTPEAIEKNRLKHLGEKNSNWLGGISPYGKEFNQIFKEAIKTRDYLCVLCGSDKSICVHHIDYNKLNNTKENCITLCRSCHCKTNYNRIQWKLFFKSYLNEKYNYLYDEVIINI